MPTGSGLWHFLYRLVSEKDVATKAHYYDAFREWC